MSDLHPPPPDPHPLNGSNPLDLQHPSTSTATAAAAAAATTTTAPKRQRRPSVRLGDIGEQPAASDPFLHRRPKPSPLFKPPPSSSNLQTLASSIRSRNPKFPKRHRNPRSSSSWSHPKLEDDDEEDEGFRSEFDDLRRGGGGGGGDEDSPDPQQTTADAGDWNEDEDDQNGNLGMDEDGGVRSWLNRLGLGRYAPVFEIHEVDDEALPLLTLEDLKDMGINAVGSRRKMYCAIQKMKKNFG